MTLPPGQRALDRFPRFGTHFRDPPPEVPSDPVIDVCGTPVRVADLATQERCTVTADFHCVAGWSALDLRWEGVPLASLLPLDPDVSHLRFHGLDGFSSVARVDDLDGALIADTLDGEPLDAKHGAPARLVSPKQYGFVSAKHLCRIEPLTHAPVLGTRAASPVAEAFLGGLGFGFFTRGRVDHEERHRLLPGWFVRRYVNPLFVTKRGR